MPPSCGTGGDKGKKGDCAPKGNCVMTMVKGALIGGVVIMGVIMASWALLPWHMKSVSAFKDEKAVAKVLTDNAPQSGVYVLPMAVMQPKDAAKETAKEGEKDKKAEATVTKPLAFVNVYADGVTPGAAEGRQMICQFATCLLMAALLTCILKKQCCGCPIMTSAKVGFIVALASAAPAAIWWHFPVRFVLLDAIDIIVAMTLAGAVLSRTVLCKKGACGTSKCG